MICMSHKGTLNLIDRIGKDYDGLPKSWKDDLVHRIEVCVLKMVLVCTFMMTALYIGKSSNYTISSFA